jgi:DNA-binding transcriptional regulator YiaG
MAGKQLTIPWEIWKPIPGFPGYEVSNHGRVRSYKKRVYIKGFTGSKCMLADEPQIILKPYPDKDGYSKVCLWKDRKPIYLKIHQLVLLAFVGPCPPGMEGCHDDGKTDNNFLSNLRWDSRANNHADKKKHGTDGRGENNTMAELTENQVKNMRELIAHGFRQADLARIYSVSRSTICNIVNYKSWKHI